MARYRPDNQPFSISSIYSIRPKWLISGTVPAGFLFIYLISGLTGYQFYRIYKAEFSIWQGPDNAYMACYPTCLDIHHIEYLRPDIRSDIRYFAHTFYALDYNQVPTPYRSVQMIAVT